MLAEPPRSLTDLPWWSLFFACCISIFAGLTNTFREIGKAIEAKRAAKQAGDASDTDIHLPLRFTTDIFVSVCIGTVVFAVCMHLDTGIYPMLAGLIVLGLGGSPVADKLVDRAGNAFGGFIDRIFGKSNKEDS